jgi:hypothetical protein
VTGRALIDPNADVVLDVAGLADLFGAMSDDALIEAELAFRFAAMGGEIRLAGAEHFVRFANHAVLIPTLIARIVRAYRLDRGPLLPALEELEADIEAAFIRGDQERELEATWLL